MSWPALRVPSPGIRHSASQWSSSSLVMAGLVAGASTMFFLVVRGRGAISLESVADWEPPGVLNVYWLLEVSCQILQDILFALLDFEQDRFRHPSVVLS